MISANDVSTWPLWEGRTSVPLPPGTVIVSNGGDVSLWNEEARLHCEMPESKICDPAMRAMSDALGAAIFDKRHPFEFMKMIRRDARSRATGEPMSIEDVALWLEYQECNPASDFAFVPALPATGATAA